MPTVTDQVSIAESEIPLLARVRPTSDGPSTASPISLPDPPYKVYRVQTLSRRSRVIRLSIFLCLEIGYIILAITCHHNPLPLPDFTPSVRGFLINVFIIWQTLAVIPVGEIAIFVFSGEWSVQLSRTGHLVPGTTDKVSTLTAGTLDRAAHLLTRGASKSFRIACVASIIFFGLQSITPGTFSSALITQTKPIQLFIGNLTFSYSFPTILFPIQRPALFARLEQLENSPVGYAIQPNWIVGWPPLDLPGVNGTVEYPSDGVSFQYECTWEAPRVDFSDGTIRSLTTTGIVWQLWEFDSPSLSPYRAGKLSITSLISVQTHCLCIHQCSCP